MFQSTRPVRGATVSDLAFTLFEGVSIHAPRAGRDAPQVLRPRQCC